MERKALATRGDLELMVERLYQRLMVDPTIGKLFTEVVHLDLSTHLPRIVDFWENVLFQSTAYQGDPMTVHLRLHGLHPLTGQDFEVWIGHFNAVVDELFEGEVAELAKQRALSIATVMQIKIARLPRP